MALVECLNVVIDPFDFGSKVALGQSSKFQEQPGVLAHDAQRIEPCKGNIGVILGRVAKFLTKCGELGFEIPPFLCNVVAR